MTPFHLALAPTPLPPGLLGGGPEPSPALQLAELADAELRLLACAVGDHLPPELHARVLEVRARQAELLTRVRASA